MTPAAKTIFQVEREARWRVWALFGLLVTVVLVCLVPIAFVAAGVLWLLQNTGSDGSVSATTAGPTLGSLLPSAGGVLLVAVLLAVLYWYLSRRSAAQRLIRMMHARPLDPNDRFHHQLSDIVEEMRAATGGPAVQCLTVPTRAMNAFTFSDLHGGACIGVTEGALSGLSRRQLQGVVAHEFGHVLSGDYVTATSACLLFGVYSSIRDSLEEGVDNGTQAGAMMLFAGMLLPLVQAASAVTNAALSRQREWEADAAAVRYTRDPLSLAQALEMMVRSPSGGYIPDGMSALCIRPTNLSASGFFARAMATHPPVDDRITRLLNVAHVGWDAFLKQDAEAEAMIEQRVHSSQAPEPDDVAAADRFAQLVAMPIAAAPIAAAPPSAAPEAAAPVTAARPVQAPPPIAPQPPAVAPSPASAAPTAPVSPGSASVLPAAPVAPAGAGAAMTMAPLVAGSAATGQASLTPEERGGVGRCPSCGGSLERFDYEGADIVICRSCGGRLVSTSQVQRILTRREMRFDERQLALAASVIDKGDELRRQDHRRRASGQIATIACPRCGRSMMRRLYSYDHSIEVDYCSICDLFWFDRDELEALQAIVERQSP